MTKINTPTTDPVPHKQNFYLGVLAGAAIGAGIAYLSSNKKGASFKKDLLAKAKNFSKQIPNLLDELNTDEEKQQPTGTQKQITLIHNNPKSNNKLEPNLTTTTKIAKTVKITGKKAKRFFTKAGKILKK